MFKVESYIAPWLLAYLDHYVKLRPADMELSLWGGDAILSNLDIRLDVLQRLTPSSVVFTNGHIHELRLHVPWTKLGSEPIVITANTVQFIAKLADGDDASRPASSASSSSSPGHASCRGKNHGVNEFQQGYLQSFFNRIINNLTFIVNNLILKFVEEDIVLSVNAKSAECYTCNSQWNGDFVEMSSHDLSLRRTINFCDLTLCLDKTNSDGHIERYQEPVIYRCFVVFRLLMVYRSLTTKSPEYMSLNAMCESVQCMLSDVQLPMLVRLVELCLALYYGYFNENHQDADGNCSSDPSSPTGIVPSLGGDFLPKPLFICLMH